ncbi:MAG: DNA-processing protein DprA [Candidatus Peregrinibacteria bacterium]|nr:DNA-processing protein DprA [Candidatus Peregrinibacteria bacterium]
MNENTCMDLCAETVKIKMYLNALKLVFPYDNKVLAKLINHDKLVNQTEKISSEWLSYIFHRAQRLELQKMGLTEIKIKELLKRRFEIDVEAEYALLLKENVSLISRSDREYPSLLNQIYNAPEVLYVQGKKSMLSNQNNSWEISIVGTRAASSYGLEVTERIVKDLKPYEPTIVSGLAMGIDMAAHSAAISNDLPTIAVLGAGHGSLKPKYGFRLIKELLTNHLVVSEYPFNIKGDKFTFPQRNRIIAGLSLATVVVEARSRSGALITAQMAAENNREVFAVPGSILSTYSRGTNETIKKSEAELYLDVPTMIETINLSAFLPFAERYPISQKEELAKQLLAARKLALLSPRVRFAGPLPNSIIPDIEGHIHRKIYDNLKCPMSIGEMIEVTGATTQELLISLTELELQGYIKEDTNQKWLRTV